jgi:hypothetical protein
MKMTVYRISSIKKRIITFDPLVPFALVGGLIVVAQLNMVHAPVSIMCSLALLVLGGIFITPRVIDVQLFDRETMREALEFEFSVRKGDTYVVKCKRYGAKLDKKENYIRLQLDSRPKSFSFLITESIKLPVFVVTGDEDPLLADEHPDVTNTGDQHTQ